MGRKRLIKDKWKIVETAFEMIEIEGINNFSTRKLAQRLGISTMTLYNYVPNMAAIEKEVVLLGFNKLNSLILKEIQMEKEQLSKDGIRLICRISAWKKIDFAEKHKEIYMLMSDPRRIDLKRDPELMPYYNYFQRIAMALRVDEKKRKSISKSLSLFDFMVNGIIINLLLDSHKSKREETDELIEYAIRQLFP